jgi:hypothetical protein
MTVEGPNSFRRNHLNSKDRLTTSAAVTASRNSARTPHKFCTPSKAQARSRQFRLHDRTVRSVTPAPCTRRSNIVDLGPVRSVAWRSSPKFSKCLGVRLSFTCPMHPDVIRYQPGSCPICGMPLEPRDAGLSEVENPELVDMRRRFWISVALSVPVFLIG